MQSFMLRLDGLLRRRRRLFVALWIVSLLVSIPFAAREDEHLTGGGFEAGGSESMYVSNAIARDFPDAAAAELFLVLVPHRDANEREMRAAFASSQRRISPISEAFLSPAARQQALARFKSRPAQPLVVPLEVPGSESNAIDVAKALRSELGIEADKAGSAAEGLVDIHVAGEGGLWAAYQADNKREVAQAEARSFPIIAVVLIVLFGSLAAAALPIVLGVSAVIVTFGVIFALSLATTMTVFVTSIVSMLGIGVAVDYSLFVLARYREEVRAGRTPDEARASALATSGVAVVFSGLTVIVSLAALFLIDSPGIRSLAEGAMVVVAISVLGAVTLLPVLIELLGTRAHEPGRIGRALARFRGRRGTRPREHTFWERWTRTVMRRPVLSVVAGAGILLMLAAPALGLKVSNTATGQLDSKNETLRGMGAAAAVIGPGALGPTLVVVDFERGLIRERSNQVALRRVKATIQRDPGVAGVTGVRFSESGRSALLRVALRMSPDSDAARHAVVRLRTNLAATTGDSAEARVGGTTAVSYDFDRLVAGSLWKIILFVLAFSFVVLVILLRSIVLPLKAVVMNILSVTAAYGVLVGVFQWGWLEWLGLETTETISTFVPPLVLVISFGLSMDYEVFLLSRIRERYAATGDNHRAVAEGLASSAGTITSAAVIMVVVLLSFLSVGLPGVKQIGLAAAVAIAVDATIVRLVLVPAAMQLLGGWNWWLPDSLARFLPRTNFEELAQTVTPSYAGVVERSPDSAG